MALTDKLTAIADAIRAKTGGTAALTLDQMPAEIAGIRTGGDGSPRVVDHVVNIAALVSVTPRTIDEFTHFFYNGVRLPRIPDDVLSQYPYAFIYLATSGYRLYVSSVIPYWYPTSNYPKTMKADGTGVRYVLDGDAWKWELDASTMYYIVDDGITWANYDIPNGSATASAIYLYGTEPIPAD